jgi:hypothetical protein
MNTPEPQGLRPKLERAQDTLRHALDRACSADLDDADTGELIRLEEVLAIANEAAKEAVSVRRKLAQAVNADAPTRSETTRSPVTHREFEDARGVRWIVFAVHPSTITAERTGFRAQYQNGWLAFDCGMETRRVAPIPEGWLEHSDEQLRLLCEHAETSRRNRPRRDAAP